MKVWHEMLVMSSHSVICLRFYQQPTIILIKTNYFFLCIRVVQGFGAFPIPFPVAVCWVRKRFHWEELCVAKHSPAQALSPQVHEGGRSAGPGSEAGSHLQGSGCQSGRRAAQRSKARSCWSGGRRRCVSSACFVKKGISNVATGKLI